MPAPLVSRILTLLKTRGWLVLELLLVAIVLFFAHKATIAPHLIIRAPDSSAHSRPLTKSDFIIFYVAGEIAHDGPHKLYDSTLEQQLQAGILGITDYAVTPYLYPPQSLLFFEPLAPLTLRAAYERWHETNAVCSFLLLLALRRAGICMAPGTMLLGALLLFSFSPWEGSMADGQPCVLMTLGLLGGWLLARQRREFTSALLLVLTAFKPPLIVGSVLFMLLLGNKHRWLALAAAGFATIAGCGVAFGFSVWPAWLHTLLATHELLRPEFGVLEMCNLRTLLLVLLGEDHMTAVSAITAAAYAIGLLASVLLALRLRQKSALAQELAFSITVVIGCVLSPYLFSVSLVLLVIPIGYALKGARLYELAGVIIAVMLTGWMSANLPPHGGAVLWVPVQAILIAWLGCKLYRECNKSVES